MTTSDIRYAPDIGHGVSQFTKRVEYIKTIDFALHPVANGDVLRFLDLRPGFVFERLDVYLLTAQGAAATASIGIAGADTEFLNAGNLNGTANARIANGTITATAGKLYTDLTLVQLTAGATINAAKIKIVFVGYHLDL